MDTWEKIELKKIKNKLEITDNGLTTQFCENCNTCNDKCAVHSLTGIIHTMRDLLAETENNFEIHSVSFDDIDYIMYLECIDSELTNNQKKAIINIYTCNFLHNLNVLKDLKHAILEYLEREY
ncbi:MAG: hypothetical protein ACTSQY_00735 [Candidatus Odinarchaeia archaeon]